MTNGLDEKNRFKPLSKKFLIVTPGVSLLFFFIFTMLAIYSLRNAISENYYDYSEKMIGTFVRQISKDLQYGDYIQVKRTAKEMSNNTVCSLNILNVIGESIFNYSSKRLCSKEALDNKIIDHVFDSSGSRIGTVELILHTDVIGRFVYDYMIYIAVIGLMLFLMHVSILFAFYKKFTKPFSELTTHIGSTYYKSYEQIDHFYQREITKTYHSEESFSLVNAFYNASTMGLKYQNEAKKNEKLAAIGQITSMLAHDVRKPFSLIKSVVNDFDRYKEDETLLESVKKSVDASINQVEAMIYDIMDFSREVKLSVKASALLPVIDFSIKQAMQSHDDTSTLINFNYTVVHRYKPFIDNERVSRVFVNILSNALDAISQNSQDKIGDVWIQTHDILRDDQPYIRLIIGNSGPYISAHDLPKVFESFFTKGKNKGTGIGLASAKRIVELHDGHISVHNCTNKQGVEFVVELPSSDEIDISDSSRLPSQSKITLQAASYQIADEFASKLESVLQKRGMFKVLLLEDEALYRESIRNTIKRNPQLDNKILLYEVSTVSDALSVLQMEDIMHAIVDIDLGTPQNGFDFLELAKENHPHLQTIVHTNRCIDEDRGRAEKLGACAFVPKPLSILDLVNFMYISMDFQFGTKEKDELTHILIVNDEPYMLQIMKQIIKSASQSEDSSIIHLAENYDDSITILSRDRIDLVFSDLNLNEEKDGFDVLEQVKIYHPKAKRYMISGTQRSSVEMKIVESNIDGYIQQPIGKESFFGLV